MQRRVLLACRCCRTELHRARCDLRSWRERGLLRVERGDGWDLQAELRRRDVHGPEQPRDGGRLQDGHVRDNCGAVPEVRRGVHASDDGVGSREEPEQRGGPRVEYVVELESTRERCSADGHERSEVQLGLRDVDGRRREQRESSDQLPCMA